MEQEEFKEKAKQSIDDIFAKIDESMKIHAGGGVNDEQIELMYLPIEQSDEFIFDESKAKTPGLMFSFYWFLKNIDTLGVK